MLLFFQVFFWTNLFNAHEFRFFQTTGEFHDLLGREFDRSRFHREKSVIAAALHILTRTKFGSALADDDISGLHFLAAEFFDTEAFGLRISAKLCGATCFSMRHKISLKVSEFTIE